jgi:site-specific DNA-methyltransferase (adenine-specific)
VTLDLHTQGFLDALARIDARKKREMKPYYQDDLITLYHGDCLEITTWLDADVLVTDPPYGIAWLTRGSYGGKSNHKGAVKEKNAVINDYDSSTRDELLDLWGSKAAVVFGSWKVDRPVATEQRLIWHKAGMPPGPLNAAFMSQDEEIYIWGQGFKKSSPPLRSVIKTDEHRPSAVKTIGHPTPKPIGLMEILIDRCPDGVIADPFAGSGATLLAARNLGRQVIGVELEEKYCELIAKRASQSAFDFTNL